MNDKPPIWESFSKALGAEYRPAKEIQGISGLTHVVQAIAVDDKSNRVIVVAAEHNPRIASLMRVDIQFTMPEARVLVARPIAFDLSHAAKALFASAAGKVDLSKLSEFATALEDSKQDNKIFSERYGAALLPLLQGVTKSDLPPLSQILDLVQQAAVLDYEKIFSPGLSVPDRVMTALDTLLTLDNLEGDRKQGICPIPTYELTEADWDLLGSGKRIDEVQERLKALEIFQYFFPPADSLALGLIEHGAASEPEISTAISAANTDGHLVSNNALVPDIQGLPHLLQELKEMGYLADGEFTMELTPAGQTIRQSVKVRPSESIFSKLLNRFSFNASVSPKDFL
ncbi:hypothetical protein [Mesorhizobium sp. ES1-4]|uniref:hypothetical protein n=1 Tax=Mesorhizobium sp. ES1-4 TaxID=2876627 RepID=UPI001CC91F1C|nr:hypothetical protein [Mesorhizobium sp. ES1-4]MBZ9795574.1 hypothetical protein [Mesorhizobium sp. ES1-4]